MACLLEYPERQTTFLLVCLKPRCCCYSSNICTHCCLVYFTENDELGILFTKHIAAKEVNFAVTHVSSFSWSDRHM